MDRNFRLIQVLSNPKIYIPMRPAPGVASLWAEQVFSGFGRWSRKKNMMKLNEKNVFIFFDDKNLSNLY